MRRALGKDPKFRFGAAAGVGMAALALLTAGTGIRVAGATEAWLHGGGPGEASLGAAALSQETPRDTAVFAGGCFWCMEPPYDKTQGVVSTVSGYAGGDVPNPSYEEVTAGGTGHREAVQVIYNPEEVAYEGLLEIFWRNVDPLDDGGQFCDRGFSYTTAIFAQDPETARLAEESKEAIQERFSQSVVTPVVQDAAFYPAEEYHQNYYQEHSIRYSFYRWNCGRDDRLEELWGQEAGGLL